MVEYESKNEKGKRLPSVHLSEKVKKKHPKTPFLAIRTGSRKRYKHIIIKYLREFMKEDSIA